MLNRSPYLLQPKELLAMTDKTILAEPTPENLLILGAIMELHDSTEYRLPLQQFVDVKSSLSAGLRTLFNTDHKAAIHIAAFSPSLKDQLELIQKAAEPVKPRQVLH